MSRGVLYRQLNKLYTQYNNLVSVNEQIPFNVSYIMSTNKQLLSSIDKFKKLIEKKCKKAKQPPVSTPSICCICRETLGNDILYTNKHDLLDSNIVLNCMHVFHRKCAKPMFFLYMIDDCPLCKRAFIYTLENESISDINTLKADILDHYADPTGGLPIDNIYKLYKFLKKRNLTFGFLDRIYKHIIDLHTHNGYIMYSSNDYDEDNSEYRETISVHFREALLFAIRIIMEENSDYYLDDPSILISPHNV